MDINTILPLEHAKCAICGVALGGMALGDHGQNLVIATTEGIVVLTCRDHASEGAATVVRIHNFICE